MPDFIDPADYEGDPISQFAADRVNLDWAERERAAQEPVVAEGGACAPWEVNGIGLYAESWLGMLKPRRIPGDPVELLAMWNEEADRPEIEPGPKPWPWRRKALAAWHRKAQARHDDVTRRAVEAATIRDLSVMLDYGPETPEGGLDMAPLQAMWEAEADEWPRVEVDVEYDDEGDVIDGPWVPATYGDFLRSRIRELDLCRRGGGNPYSLAELLPPIQAPRGGIQYLKPPPMESNDA